MKPKLSFVVRQAHEGSLKNILVAHVLIAG
jgi:hypothetical protein